MLRKISRKDLPDLLAIEQAVSVMPWTETTFKSCFLAGYTGWAAIEEQKIIGFIMLSLHNQECHILNLCVDSHHQHQGWGIKLLKFALTDAKENNITIAYLEVRRSNVRAISLYRKLDFHLIGERSGYYPTSNGNEDALIFAKSLRNGLL